MENFDKYRKKINKGQIAGTRGEMFVGFLLSSHCLVRPVANGTDVGVDLYCEALIEGIPHSHFWVQVKTQTKRLAKSKKFETRDLEYWSRQPIPVFIFLVSCEKMDRKNFQINVINLTEKFIAEPVIDPKTTSGKNLTSDFTVSSDGELKSFVFEQVPKTVARLYIRDGVIFHTRKNAGDNYEKEYDFKGISKYTRSILKNIGRTSALLMRDILDQGTEETQTFRKQLGEILETFSKWGNYDFHLALGLSKQRHQDYKGAIICFERALNNINTDTRFDKAKGSVIKKMIVTRIELCKSKLRESETFLI